MNFVLPLAKIIGAGGFEQLVRAIAALGGRKVVVGQVESAGAEAGLYGDEKAGIASTRQQRGRNISGKPYAIGAAGVGAAGAVAAGTGSRLSEAELEQRRNAAKSRWANR